MLPSETPWDLDQRLKSTIREANMTLTDAQHCACFVASLTPHLRIAQSQQKISTQAEALEIAMRLHETPISDPGLGVQQIHAQLQNLSLEMQSLKQERVSRPEVCVEVGCIKCKSQAHDKDHCPVFANYLARGGPMPLKVEVQEIPSAALALWCAICQVGGKHATDNCHLLEKYTQTPQQLYCNFCRSVGHDEGTCRSYDLMMERTLAYRMQTEVQGGFQGRGRGRGMRHGRGRG